MPNGYWIARVTVIDADQYRHYAAAAPSSRWKAKAAHAMW